MLYHVELERNNSGKSWGFCPFYELSKVYLKNSSMTSTIIKVSHHNFESTTIVWQQLVMEIKNKRDYIFQWRNEQRKYIRKLEMLTDIFLKVYKYFSYPEIIKEKFLQQNNYKHSIYYKERDLHITEKK